MVYINDQHDKLSRFGHVRELVSQFWKYRSELFYTLCSSQDIGSLQHIAAIQTERSESSACIENFFIWWDIFKMPNGLLSKACQNSNIIFPKYPWNWQIFNKVFKFNLEHLIQWSKYSYVCTHVHLYTRKLACLCTFLKITTN